MTDDADAEPFGMPLDITRYPNINMEKPWPLPPMNANIPDEGVIFTSAGRMHMVDGMLVPLDHGGPAGEADT